MSIPQPTGSGIGLGEFLELLRKGVNKSELTGDDRILVEEHAGGRNLSYFHKPEVFFGRITGWEKYGYSGKRWKYSWEEVNIGEIIDEAQATGEEGLKDKGLKKEGGRTGTFEDKKTTFLINIAEINNSLGSANIQGNGMQLVAPIGGGSSGAATGSVHSGTIDWQPRIVPIWTGKRKNGTTFYWTDIVNSDHVLSEVIHNIGADHTSDGHDENESHVSKTNEYIQASSEVGQEKGDYLKCRNIEWVMGARVNFQHCPGDSILREFYRTMTITPNGKIIAISEEQSVVIDAPEECDEE